MPQPNSAPTSTPEVARLLSVRVRSRQGLVYEGDLWAVTSYNQVGQFDILPGHSNFVTMITKKLILRRSATKNEEINVDNGVLIVEGNHIEIFLGVSKV